MVRSSSKWLTKPGKHGVLSRFKVAFESRFGDEGRESYSTWAYDKEHAEEKFWEWLQQYNPGKDEFRVLSIRQVAIVTSRASVA